MPSGSKPPVPAHILRLHSSQINDLSFSIDNERLYSADAAGRVVVTSTRTLRALASWQAHKDSVLGAQEWEDKIITSVGFVLYRATSLINFGENLVTDEITSYMSGPVN